MIQIERIVKKVINSFIITSQEDPLQKRSVGGG